jgi:hypothetical protein
VTVGAIVRDRFVSCGCFTRIGYRLERWTFGPIGGPTVVGVSMECGEVSCRGMPTAGELRISVSMGSGECSDSESAVASAVGSSSDSTGSESSMVWTS